MVFSLRHCTDSGPFGFDGLDQECKAAFASAMHTRRSMTWRELRNAPRHGLGQERIAVSAINASIPSHVAEGGHTLIVFRFNGKAPMVGYRDGAVFYVLFFDPDFRLYKHG